MNNATTLGRYANKFPKSRELYERAQRVFPRGVSHDARHVEPFPLYMTHSSGSRKWDVDGNEFIDYFGGHGALMLGHAHPSLVSAVNKQIARGTHYAACHELEIEWGELVQKLVPSAELVEFTSSGTEANMMGVRLARAFTGRSRILRFRGQFAGWYDDLTVGTVEPWHIPATGGIIPQVAESTLAIPVNDETALEEALSRKDIAVLVCEAAGAYSGVSGIAPSFYQAMRKLTEKYGTLLLLDEVVTGFRWSPGGVQEVRGITPDLTSLGKIITGGLPGAGATVGRTDIMNLLLFKDEKWNRFKRVTHQGTFNANPLCAAAGIATLNLLADGKLQEKAARLATELGKGMEGAINEKGISSCVYGESSVRHVYFGECELRGNCDRTVCLNTTKLRPTTTGALLNQNLALNGVHPSGRGTDFYLSSEHTEKDVADTIKAFAISIDALLEEGVLVKN